METGPTVGDTWQSISLDCHAEAPDPTPATGQTRPETGGLRTALFFTDLTCYRDDRLHANMTLQHAHCVRTSKTQGGLFLFHLNPDL